MPLKFVTGIILTIVAGLCLIVALGALGFAVIAQLGALADVSLAENRAMARQLLGFALIPGVGGLALLAVGLALLMRGKKADQ